MRAEPLDSRMQHGFMFVSQSSAVATRLKVGCAVVICAVWHRAVACDHVTADGCARDVQGDLPHIHRTGALQHSQVYLPLHNHLFNEVFAHHHLAFQLAPLHLKQIRGGFLF